MKKVSYNLGIKKYINIKHNNLIKDSLGRKSVTVYIRAVLNKCVLEGKNCIYSNANLKNVHLGYGAYINTCTTLNDTYIGAFSSISSFVRIINGRHPIDYVSTYPGFYSNSHLGIATYADKVYFEEFEEKKFFDTYSTYIGNDVLMELSPL